MIKGEDEDFEELRRRLARVELLASIALIGSNADLDEETSYFLSRYFREYSRSRRSRDERGLFGYEQEFDFLLQRLSKTGSSRSNRIERDFASLKTEQDSRAERFERDLAFFKTEQEVSGQINSNRIEVLSRKLEEATSLLNELSVRNTDLSAGTHEWLAIQSLGIDTAEAKITRFIPLRVYLSDNPKESIEEISDAIALLLRAFDFEISDDFPAVYGSWFKKWYAKTVDVVTQPEVLERLEKIERAVELKGLGEPQANIDLKQSEAISCLLKAVESIPNAAIQAGSILLVKITSKNGPAIQVRTLSQRELIHLENNQKLLKSPASILDKLTQLCQPPNDLRIEK